MEEGLVKLLFGILSNSPGAAALVILILMWREIRAATEKQQRELDEERIRVDKLCILHAEKHPEDGAFLYNPSEKAKDR